MVLLRLSRPRNLRPENESYFGFMRMVSRKWYINCIRWLQNPTLKAPKSFTTEWSTVLSESQPNWVGLSSLFEGSLMEHLGRHVAFPISKNCSTVVINVLTGSSSSLWLLLMLVCLHAMGPMTGTRHDLYMLARLELIPNLQDFIIPAQNAWEDIAAG